MALHGTFRFLTQQGRLASNQDNQDILSSLGPSRSSFAAALFFRWRDEGLEQEAHLLFAVFDHSA
jgi:hypothetical protein